VKCIETDKGQNRIPCNHQSINNQEDILQPATKQIIQITRGGIDFQSQLLIGGTGNQTFARKTVFGHWFSWIKNLFTWATVCSPSGISSARSATLCTTFPESASKMILKNKTRN